MYANLHKYQHVVLWISQICVRFCAIRFRVVALFLFLSNIFLCMYLLIITLSQGLLKLSQSRQDKLKKVTLLTDIADVGFALKVDELIIDWWHADYFPFFFDRKSDLFFHVCRGIVFSEIVSNENNLISAIFFFLFMKNRVILRYFFIWYLIVYLWLIHSCC